MEKKWNLGDIRPQGERKQRRTTAPRHAAPVERETPRREPSNEAPRKRRARGGKRRPLVVAAAVFILILVPALVLSYFMGGAEVTVYPRTQTPHVDGEFTAVRSGSGELGYEIMTLEAEGERQVPATGEEEVSLQATGEIVIKNTGDSTERLVKNTRFESPEGLIFLIAETAVIPAATEDESGATVPGTVRAEVFAQEPGEEYNIEPTTFTVPGYEEGGYDELFAAITAESTSPMTGGFVGTRYTIDDETLAAAKDSLHAELREALLPRAQEERPAGFILFEPSITFTYESLPSVEVGENMVAITEKASLNAPIFESRAFASHIAEASIPGYEGEAVRIDDPSALAFSFSETGTSSATTTDETAAEASGIGDLRDLDSFSFTLVGDPRIVWTFDMEALKSDLAGAAKTALPTILSGYPAIERAEAVIRPFFERSFPENPEKITITEVLDDAE